MQQTHVKDTGRHNHIYILMSYGGASCPGGRFPSSFIHQVIIITGLNKLQLYVLALKIPTGLKTFTQTLMLYVHICIHRYSQTCVDRHIGMYNYIFVVMTVC